MRRVLLLCLLTAGAVVAFFGLMAGVLWLRLAGPAPTKVASLGPTTRAVTQPSDPQPALVARPAPPAPPADSDAPPEPAAPPVAGPVGQVMRLALVDADNGNVVGVLFNGVTLDLGSLPPNGFTLRADVSGAAASVRFEVDGTDDGEGDHTDNDPPYAIAGDRDGRYVPWRLAPGEHRMVVTSYAEPDADGERGQPLRVKFRAEHVVRPRAGGRITLSAAAARLRGGEIRLATAEEEGGGEDFEEFIGWWTSRKDHAEWTVDSPGEAEYHVDVTYSCEDGAGGEFVLAVGRNKLPGEARPTDGWQHYRTARIGALRLPPGRFPVAVRPGGRMEHALMNLRRIEFVPVTAADPLPPTVLYAADARVRGRELRIESDDEEFNDADNDSETDDSERRERRHVGSWSRAGDHVEWPVELSRGGRYRVELTYACDDGNGGGFVVSVGGRNVKGQVGPTGGWDKYRTADFGTVELRPMRTKLRVAPAGRLDGRSLMNLRAVRLVPTP